MVSVRQVRADEWREYRAIRLAALAESPDAFGSTLAAEQMLPDHRWQERTAGGPGAERVLFVAIDDSGVDASAVENAGRWIGLAGSYTPGDPPADTELISMWVDPIARKSGAGAALVEAVIGWATAKGFATLGLWVTEGNVAAQRLYERCGFVDNGERQPLPSNPTLQEVRMLRSL
jgi:GNAT superfamily N-acetyltransferase